LQNTTYWEDLCGS